MPIAEIEMPNGKVAEFEFPEGTTPEQAEMQAAAWWAEQGQAAEPEKPLGALGTLAETGRVVGKAVKEGVFGLPNLAETLVNKIPGGPPEGYEAPLDVAAREKGFTPLNERIESIVREATEPKTAGGKAIGNIASSTVGALTGGGALRQAPGAIAGLGQLARVGTAAGVGGEGAGQMFPDQPLARLAGGLAGGGLYGLAEGSISNFINSLKGAGRRKELASALTEGLDPRQIDEAAALQQAAKTEQGVNLSGGQVLPASNIPAFELMATQFRQGAGLAKMFRGQPDQVRQATEAAKGTIPGTVRPMPEMASKAQEAATQAIQGAKNWRSDLVRQDYMGQIPVEQGLKIQELLKGKLRESAQGTDKADLIAQLKSRLMKQVGTEQMPVISTQEIKEQMRQVMKDAVNPSLSAKQYSTEARNALANTIKEVKQLIGDVKPEFARAERTFNRASEHVVNPLKEEIVGKMAGATGYIAGKPAGSQALLTALDKGTAQGGKSSILTAQKQLSRFAGEEGKQAYNDTVKTWIANKIDNALEFDGGIPSAKTAENITNAFFKNEAQRQGLKDALAGVAKNTNQSPEVLVKGMENYLRTMAAASKVPPKIGPNRAAINEEINTMLGKLNAITAFTPVRMPARMINEYFKRDAVAHVAKLLESPEGLKALQVLANTQPGSGKSFAAAAAFSSILVQGNLANQQGE